MARRSARFAEKLAQDSAKSPVSIKTEKDTISSPDFEKEVKPKLFPLFTKPLSPSNKATTKSPLRKTQNAAHDSKNLKASTSSVQSPSKLAVKKSPAHSDSDSTESDSTNKSDSDSSQRSKSLAQSPHQPNTNKTKKNESMQSTKREAELSEYEKKIQQNIEERKKMFQMLVGDAKKDFMSTVKPVVIGEKNKITHRGLKRKVEESIEVPPLRMSLRSRGKLPDKEIEETPKEKKPDVRKPYKSGTFTLAEVNVNQDLDEDTKLFEEMIPLLKKEGELEKLPSDQQEFLKLMQQFNIQEEGVAKVVSSRIYSLDWHPSTCKLLIAAGDRDGNIGFWDVDKVDDKQHGVRTFKLHGMPVNCVTFDKFNTTRLLSTSYDGCVRSLDLNTNVVDEVFSVKRTNNNWTAYHVQIDPSTLLVSQSNGDVVVVDMRSKPGRAENLIQCFELSARTLSLHPQDEKLFMVCNRFGEVGIFDVRYTAENEDDLAVPVIGFPKAPKGVHGAFFSPITGQYALTTCTNDTISIYNVQKGSAEPECIKSIYHNNFTGRWLTPFKAVWHPQREDVFIVGSMEKPRRVELFGAPTGQLLHNFDGDWLASVCSINSFHPSAPIFAGGNSSGRVHIFRS